MKKTEQVILRLANRSISRIDAIAKLSGVSRDSVVKVLLALAVLGIVVEEKK